MPPRKQPWFRFYVEAIWDRKLRRLPEKTRWLWVVVLACAKSSPLPGYLLLTEGEPMGLSDFADAAAMQIKDVKSGLQTLEGLRLVARDENNGALFVPRWNERQFNSDSSTERTAKHRSRNGDVTHQIQRTETESDTEPEPDRETSQDLKSEKPAANGHKPSAADLVDRINATCKNPDSRMATRVVDTLTDYVDESLIDECVGFAARLDLNKQPRDPSYFLTAVHAWAKDRKIPVPDRFLLPAEPEREGLQV